MNLKIETKALGESFLNNATQAKKNGSGSDFGALLRHAETKQSAADAELEKYVKMSPAERMSKAIMKSLGISQEAFNAMSPAEQASVLAKVSEILKQKMEEQVAQNQGAAKL
jgi:hypothetical protein